MRRSDQELSQAVTLLRNAARNILGQMNTRRSINKLPTEVLMEIFSLLQDRPPFLDLSIVGTCGPFKIKESANRLPILRVCRLWHDVALATPSLWSSFSSTSPAARKYNSLIQATPHSPPSLDLLIPPSDRPLYIHVQLPVHAPLAHRLLNRARHRVKELHVDVLKPWNQDPFQALLPFPAPELCRLVVYGREASYFDGPRADAALEARRRRFRETWCGPQVLCGGDTPRLARLALVDLPFLPRHLGGTMPSLTHFTYAFRRREDAGAGTCSVTHLLDFLGTTPALQELYVNVALHGDDIHIPPVNGLPSNQQARRPIRLDHLRKFSVLTVRNHTPRRPGLSDPYQVFFSRLALPHTCCIRVTANLDFLLHIRALAKYAQRRPWDYVKLHCVVGRRRLGASVSLQLVGCNNGGGFRLDLSPDGRLGEKVSRNAAIMAVLSLPPFTHASEVWLSGSGLTSSSLLRGRNNLSASISPKALYLVDARSFFQESLRILWPSSCYTSSATVPMPALETIYVHVPVDDGIGLVQFKLVDLLQARAGAGCRLERLYVRTTPRITPCPADAVEAWGQKVRNMCSAHVDEVQAGETVYEPLSLSRAMPRVCTDADEIHAFWPLWVEGVTVQQKATVSDASCPPPISQGDDNGVL
ncbi:hypothetical protein BV20DRAFT_676974 [Pilatotrama ljubarskyi]|nr:hypothetical protein BV20DRAFT_676974 [Pilatotrama ljubarskyi]